MNEADPNSKPNKPPGEKSTADSSTESLEGSELLSPIGPPRSFWPVMITAILFPSVLTWAYFVGLADPEAGRASLVQQLTFQIGKVIQFGFPILWVVFVLKEKHRPRRPGPGLLSGGLFGLAVLTAILGLYHWCLAPMGLFTNGPKAEIQEKVVELGFNSPWKYAAVSVFYAICHSFLEEYYWRWFVFRELDRRTTFTKALLLSSFGFMAHHVIVLATFFGWDSPATYLFSLAIAAGGAVWAVIYHRTQSLWGCWISHLLVDAAIFFIGYDLLKDVLTG